MTYRAAQIIEHDLREQPDPTWQQVAELVSWLFGINGNSSVSMSYEVMAEIQPLSWEPDDVAFALEIITEAEAIMADALTALKTLNDAPMMLHTLQTNLQTIYKWKGKKHDRPQLIWTRSGERNERAAEPESSVLQLRDDAA